MPDAKSSKLVIVESPAKARTISRVSPSARWIASRVISWNTMRRTGTFGSSTSDRCQAIASPSRSSSVASSTSEAPLRCFFRAATTFFLSGLTT